MLYDLHMLRAVAALLVVYYHTVSDAGLGFRGQFGAFGVDVFFVISGFIVSYVSVKSPDDFMTRRLIRVVPFYWCATLALFAVALLMPSVLRQTRPDWMHLLHSLFFIPYAKADGSTFPLMILGWTLNYEIYFYALFAIALKLDPRRAPLLTCGAIVAILGALTLAKVEHPVAAFYADTIVLEFCYGVLIYHLHAALVARGARPAIPPLVLLLGVVACFVWMAFAEMGGALHRQRALVVGVPAALVVLAAVLHEHCHGPITRGRTSWVLGESSYILYLSHPYVIYGALRLLLPKGTVMPLAAQVALAIALIIASTLVAVAIHLWMEKPAMAYLRRLLLKETPRRTVASAA